MGELFTGFLLVGLRGFGGVMPWARRMVVEERAWLDGAEFTNLVSLCQLLPGPNIVNLSVALGARFRGLPGAGAALGGLMLAPLAIVLVLGTLYQRYGSLPSLGPMFRDVGAAAAGLVVATGCKMSAGHWREPRSVATAVVAFAAVAIFRWPLIAVVAVLAPVSLLLHAGRPR